MDPEVASKLFNLKEDIVSDPEFAKYLLELGSLSVDQLNREPDRLADERSAVLEETETLAFENYKTFIQAANSTKDIYYDFTHIEIRLSGLIEKVPTVTKACNDFLQEAQKINSNRQAYSITMSRHTQMLEILEIPQVMDTCLRGGYYDEALELSNYFAKLERRLSHIPIIVMIGEELRKQKDQLVSQLEQHLHGNLGLPQCLKVVGLLKRLNVYTEAELRIKFLVARNAWLESQLAAAPKDDTFQHISRVIDISRVSLFDIVTQYRAVFSDDDPLAGISLQVPRTESAFPVNLPNILNGWMFWRVQQFIKTLESDLEKGVGGRVDSVYTQCQFFGQSFARVGCDFRGFVIPIFTKSVFYHFARAVSTATENLTNLIVHNHVRAFASPSYAVVESECSVSQQETVLRCSLELSKFPPLAIFLNEILTFFNEHRSFLPLSQSEKMSTYLEKSLENIAAAIKEVKHCQSGTSTEEQQKQIDNFSNALLKNLAVALNDALEKLFPVARLAEALEMNLSEFLMKKPNCCRINLRKLADLLGVQLSPDMLGDSISLTFAAATTKPVTKPIEPAPSSAKDSQRPKEQEDNIASASSEIVTGNAQENFSTAIVSEIPQHSVVDNTEVKKEVEDLAQSRLSLSRKATFSIGDDPLDLDNVVLEPSVEPLSLDDDPDDP